MKATNAMGRMVVGENESFQVPGGVRLRPLKRARQSPRKGSFGTDEWVIVDANLRRNRIPGRIRELGRSAEIGSSSRSGLIRASIGNCWLQEKRCVV